MYTLTIMSVIAVLLSKEKINFLLTFDFAEPHKPTRWKNIRKK
jgi:hypothetical protein